MPATNTLVLTWVDWAGNSHALDNSAHVLAVVGATDLFAPPYMEIASQLPIGAGVRLRYVNVGERIATLPLVITGTSFSDLWTRARSVANWFDPTQPRGSNASVSADGNGQLQAATPDGTTRALNCSALVGLDGVLDDANYGAGYLLLPVELHAMDPYWYDTAATNVGGVACTSGVLKSTSITTAGDVEAWPIFTITFTVATSQSAGTLTVVLANTTSGYSLTLTSIPIASTSGATVAHSLVIDTRPGVKSITLDGATNCMQYRTATNPLWPLVAGLNNLNYTITESQTLSVGISVAVSYTNRYQTV